MASLPPMVSSVPPEGAVRTTRGALLLMAMNIVVTRPLGLTHHLTSLVSRLHSSLPPKVDATVSL